MSAAHFIHEDFLLETPAAQELYHSYAKSLPIIDYHCHIDPAEVATNHRFRSLTELWLAHDHYKWRALRAHGTPEHLITGDASDWKKFQAWAEVVPHTLRNPLYHWTHLELAFPFGIKDRQLGPNTAKDIFDECNARLAQPRFFARGLLEQHGVEVVCTTDDPTDSLQHHLSAREDSSLKLKLLPTWRPDRALDIGQPEELRTWLDDLEHCTQARVSTYDQLLEALAMRHDFFHQAGCRLSDHGITRLEVVEFSLEQVRAAFAAARQGKLVPPQDAAAYRSALLHELAVMDHERDWVQQYHLGPLRNLNSRRFTQLGPNTGFDAMGDDSLARPLAGFLDRLDQTDRLAKTIVYNINPRDNDLLATILGCFQSDVPGKMQLGSAWWFSDQLSGMAQQLESLSNHGLLSHFVGMLTDSRSLLSSSRHEYFRRLLCNLLGRDMERGVLPRDFGLVGGLVERVCHRNARDYFDFSNA